MILEFKQTKIGIEKINLGVQALGYSVKRAKIILEDD